MAYTIIRSNGTTLTTIPDGNINTTSTSLGLPGRNYPGYGQILDTNFVRITENFANTSPPPNPLKGQMWYDTTANVMKICPADGTVNGSTWRTITTTDVAGDATLGNITLTGNLEANNASIGHNIECANISATNGNITHLNSVSTANIASGNLGALTTTAITSGAVGTPGTLTGAWSFAGNISVGSVYTLTVSGAASSAYGIKCDNYMYANGSPFTPSGTYTNGNVYDYLTGSNSIGQFSGNIAPTKVTTSTLAGGGNIAGIWTLDSGARIQATYADLAERFEADAAYDTGTVVEIGGDKEITAVQEDLSEEVFGVVSTASAFTMNGVAGTDLTHPAIAVSGRVPVKVIGKVKKGQRLVSAGHGYARAAKRDEMTAFNVIGRALENKTSEGSGTVLAVVAITK